MSMKTPRPNAVSVRIAFVLLALGSTAGAAFAQALLLTNTWSPNNPIDVARSELQKAETKAVTFDPQSPERNAVEGRAQQLRAQIADSFAIYGAGVKKPGLYLPKPGLTVTEAIKLAGGTTPDAEVANVRLSFKANRISAGHQLQLSGANLDLADIIPMPAGLPPDVTAPSARTYDPALGRGRQYDYNYDFVINAGDSIRIDATEFRFDGGTPKDFLKTIDAHYLTDWQDLATIPPQAAKVNVPKIKTTLQQTVVSGPGLGVEHIQRKSASALLELYNALAADQPALGQWKMDPQPAGGGRGGRGSGVGSQPKPQHPDLVVVQSALDSRIGTKTVTTGQQIRAKALALKPLPPEQWGSLGEEISNDLMLLFKKLDNGTAESREQILRFRGSVQVDPKTAVLLVVGTEEYIELIESILAARRANLAADPRII